MADHHLFVWQRSLSMILVSGALGFITGFSLTLDRTATTRSVIPITWSERLPNLDPNLFKVKVPTAQPNEAYNNVISTWVKEEQARRLSGSIPVEFQGKTIRDVKLKGEHKAIALTFDDGPWPNTTTQILDVLKENQVKATFFVIGKQVQKHPELTQQIVINGHAIGNHSWSHGYHQYNSATAAREIDNTAELIYKTTNAKTSIFRPPGGILNNGLVAYANQKKYVTLMWSIDSKDWRSRRMTTQGFVDNVLKDAKPGGIVLLHDGGGDRSKTIQALPKLITELKNQGYQFVTVPDLLEMGTQEAEG